MSKKLTPPAPDKSTDKTAPDEEAIIDAQREDADVSVSEIQDLLESADLNGAFVRIMRLAPGANDYSYCATMTVSAFDFEQVKETYGGGRYKLQLLDSNKKYVKQRAFSIDPRVKGKLDRKEGEPDPAKPVEPAAAAVKEVLAAQERSTNFLLTMMMENSKSQIAMMTAALGGASRGGGIDLKDVVALLPFLLDKGKPGMGPKELMDLFKQMRELTDGEDKDSPSTLDKLVEVLPQVAARFGGAMRGQGPGGVPPGNGQPRRAGPAPAAAALPAPPPAAAPETELERVLHLTLSGARRNSDPALYADMILDYVDADNEEQIKNVLTAEGWFGLLFPDAPDAAALMPWMEQLRELILKTLNEPPPPDEIHAERNGAAVPAGGGDPAGLPALENPERAGAGP